MKGNRIWLLAATGAVLADRRSGMRECGTTKSPVEVPDFVGHITVKERAHYLNLFSRPADGRTVATHSGFTATMLDGGQSFRVTREGRESSFNCRRPGPIPLPP